MRTTTLVVALGLAAVTLPAWAQSAGSEAGRPPWQSPGEPLAAAQTTRQYVPNRDVVSAVQQRLNQLGYDTAVNGNYDANLRNSVIRFQSETGLRPTGEVDLSTIGALGINVEPRGMIPQSTAMAPAPPPADMQQTAELGRGYRQLLERSEYMSGPQLQRQATPLENTAGTVVSSADLRPGELPPGYPPGYPLADFWYD